MKAKGDHCSDRRGFLWTGGTAPYLVTDDNVVAGARRYL
jgi:hypothetical protein